MDAIRALYALLLVILSFSLLKWIRRFFAKRYVKCLREKAKQFGIGTKEEAYAAVEKARSMLEHI